MVTAEVFKRSDSPEVQHREEPGIFTGAPLPYEERSWTSTRKIHKRVKYDSVDRRRRSIAVAACGSCTAVAVAVSRFTSARETGNTFLKKARVSSHLVHNGGDDGGRGNADS